MGQPESPRRTLGIVRSLHELGARYTVLQPHSELRCLASVAACGGSVCFGDRLVPIELPLEAASGIDAQSILAP